MSQINASEGRIEISGLLDETFLGSSGPGVFPPPDKKYQHFTCQPNADENGILVFIREQMIRPYQYWWEKGKVICKSGIHRAKPYSNSKELGFMVQVEQDLYTTEEQKDAGLTYRVVNLFSMLRYIENKISDEDLQRAARMVQRRKRHDQTRKDIEQRNKSILDRCQEEWKEINRSWQHSSYEFQAEVNRSREALDQLISRLKPLLDSKLLHFVVTQIRPTQGRMFAWNVLMEVSALPRSTFASSPSARVDRIIPPKK